MTVSEAASKKRGRPRKYSTDTIAVMRGLWGPMSSRTLRKRTAMQLAFGALLGEGEPRRFLPEFAWLWRHGDLRLEILAELGQLEDREAIRAVAARICGLRPRTKDALRMLRQHRLRIEPEPVDTSVLVDALVRCVDELMRRYPATTKAQLVEALDGAREVLE